MASNTHVTLFLIDYGDICEVEWKFSRSLLSQFQELPAQAIQAKLLGVKPNTDRIRGTWDSSASKLLRNATGNSSDHGVVALMTSRERFFLTCSLTSHILLI